MKEIAAAVQEGAEAYLTRQFRTLSVFAVLVFFLLLLLPADDCVAARSGGRSSSSSARCSRRPPATSACGSPCAATCASPRARQREPRRTERAMRIAFRTGGVVGMFTVGLGLLGAAVVVLIYRGDAPKVLEGFGFGAALLAMFMRVGGGIFTKAADVGADLVGKVEQGIPEDDPRNAATIADNVGDNVGDCAGMAADLFESYAVTLVAALILGKAAFGDRGPRLPADRPRHRRHHRRRSASSPCHPRPGDKSGMTAINRGFFISAVISVVLVAIAAFVYLPSYVRRPPRRHDRDLGARRRPADPRARRGGSSASCWRRSSSSSPATSPRPTGARSTTSRKTSLTGPATVILSGISVGLESAVYTALLIGGAVYGAFLLGGSSIILSLFAVALAGTGLLTTVGVIVVDGHLRPGLRQRPGHRRDVRRRRRRGRPGAHRARRGRQHHQGHHQGHRDRDGRARGDGALRLVQRRGRHGRRQGRSRRAAHRVRRAQPVDSTSPSPTSWSACSSARRSCSCSPGLAINAVSRAAGAVVFEVRRQFREHPGIMDGTEQPEYGRVVDICTRDSLRELATPGLLAVLTPIAVGFAPRRRRARLRTWPARSRAGTLMAVFLANSGGAWDNAKKFVEDGHHGGKGSEAHAATVIGDTVGDPFKDTAGPAINPLIKVMNLVALLIAPAIVQLSYGDDANTGAPRRIALVALRSSSSSGLHLQAPPDRRRRRR